MNLDLKKVSIEDLEKVLIGYQAKREEAMNNDEFYMIHDINKEEDEVLQNWFSEVLGLFDRINGIELANPRTSEWINAS